MRRAAARALALATRTAASTQAPLVTLPSLRQIEDVLRDPLPPPPPPPASAASDPFLSRPDVSATVRGPLGLYAARRLAGRVRRDPRQEAVILELQRVYDDVTGGAGGARSGLTLMDAMPEADGGDHGGWLSSLFGGDDAKPKAATAGPPRGLYMYGGVGTGKTMLMDMFVEAASPVVKVRERGREKRGCVARTSCSDRSAKEKIQLLFMRTPAC